MSPSIVNFEDLLEALSREVVLQQIRLNFDFENRVRAFRSTFELAREIGREGLVQSLAPRMMALDQAEFETFFRAASAQLQQVEFGVQPLNMGFSRRFAYSSYKQNRISLSMRRVTEQREVLKENSTT